MSKSLISSLPDLSTSYSYEIKELREKVLYWKRTSEIHHLEGFHIMAELYSEYMKKAQKELEELLDIEKEEQKAQANKTPKRFFLKKVSCSFYKPVLPALETEETEKEETETEDSMNEDKILTYESIPHFEQNRIYS